MIEQDVAAIPAMDGPPKHANRDLDGFNREVNAWHDQGGFLYCDDPVQPGDWLLVLDECLSPRVACSGGVAVGGHAPIWSIEIGDSLPDMQPRTDLPREVPTVLIPSQVCRVSIRAGLRLYRMRVHEVWTRESNGWMVRSPEALLVMLLYHRRIRGLIRRIFPTVPIADDQVIHNLATRLRLERELPGPRAIEGSLNDRQLEPGVQSIVGLAPSGEDLWHDFIETDNDADQSAPLDRSRPTSVVQYIGSLYSGGAERQLCNVAIGVHQRGFESRVLTQHDLTGPQGHYLSLLEGEDLTARQAIGRPSPEALHRVRWDLVAATPDAIRPHVGHLALEFATNPPDIVHAWLDHPNVIAGLAALAADVRCVLLSTRNYNPTHFPRFYSPFLEWYRILARSRRVHWLANSHEGARSYAEYVGMPVEQFHVVFNGLFRGHFDRPATKQRHEARKALGLPDDVPVIAVINRMDHEKQPLMMLKVISMLRHDIPNVRVVVAGSGAMEDQVRRSIRRHGLEGCVTMLGRVRDVVPVMSAADVLLLTSALEGCPNVLLEAQHCGLPVVATNVGGTCDAVCDGRTGILVNKDDVPGAVLALRRLLEDEGLRRRMAIDAQRYVDECFALDTMVDLHFKVYELMLEGDRTTRIITPKPTLPEAPVERQPREAPAIIPRIMTTKPEITLATSGASSPAISKA